jgi:hypothetical protein
VWAWGSPAEPLPYECTACLLGTHEQSLRQQTLTGLVTFEWRSNCYCKSDMSAVFDRVVQEVYQAGPSAAAAAGDGQAGHHMEEEDEWGGGGGWGGDSDHEEARRLQVRSGMCASSQAVTSGLAQG